MFLQLTYWFIINVNNQNIYDVAPRLVSVPNMKQIISYAYSIHNQKSELMYICYFATLLCLGLYPYGSSVHQQPLCCPDYYPHLIHPSVIQLNILLSVM